MNKVSLREAAMFEGKTTECLALANTAILMRLIEQLIEHGAIARPIASTMLEDAMSDLQKCADASRTVEAVTIIRNELIPRFFELTRPS
jgi:hypothetical protein